MLFEHEDFELCTESLYDLDGMAYRQDPQARLEHIAHWIGTPAGRGRIIPSTPALGIFHEVQTFEADGSLNTRRIRLRNRLGSGLAGTVYLVEDDTGSVFVEKHFGSIPATGSKQFGRWLTGALFALFRQAPLSFRELPEAVISSHLTNRFVVSLSQNKYGYSITPSILYTRYDVTTGGYVQAFEYVEGRPLRPCDGDLPLLGEGGLFRGLMQQWRDFLADDLGFWGLARQVDPSNPNSFSNIWVTGEQHVLLLDIVPGLPGFLEPRYIWLGLSRRQFPPFSDAINFVQLENYLSENALETSYHDDFELLRVAVDRWQDSEPRLWASPTRALQILRSDRLRQAQRRALLVHLEVKGAISGIQVETYRSLFEATGRYPKLLRHTLLKMCPLSIHRALTDGSYALALIINIWAIVAWLGRLMSTRVRSFIKAALVLLTGTFKLLVNRDERHRRCHLEIGEWIEFEQRYGRLSSAEADRHRGALQQSEIADLTGLFLLHTMVGGLKQAFLGPSVLWLGAAVATEQLWLLAPALVSPFLRLAATIWVGLWRRPELVLLSAIPTIGVLAAPLYLIRRRTELGAFIIRSVAQKLALRIPGFGEYGSLTELLAVAVAHVVLIKLGGLLPLFLVTAVGLALIGQPMLAAVATAIYAAIVVRVCFKMSKSPGNLSAWRLGMPLAKVQSINSTVNKEGSAPVGLPAPPLQPITNQPRSGSLRELLDP